MIYYNMTNEILITMLLSVIAFWLIRYIQRSDKRLDYFTLKIEELSEKIAVIIERYDNQAKSCDLHHNEINKRFDNHELRINKLEKKND